MGDETERDVATSPGHGDLPWQRRDDLGGLRAFTLTLRGLVANPRALFRALEPRRPWTGPLFYGALVSLIGQALEMSMLALVGPYLPAELGGRELDDFLGQWGVDTLSSLPQGLVSFLGLQFALLSLPVVLLLAILLLVVWSAASHLVLRANGGVRASSAGYRGTFAVFCYASTGALAQVVPLLGDFLFLVLLVVWSTIGIGRVHGTGATRAVFAVLLPPVLLIAGGIAVTILATV